MDPRTFDRLTRLVGVERTRRGVLKAIAGGAIGAMAAAVGRGETAARARRSVGNSCATNADCASAADCPAGDLCRSAACLPSGYCGTCCTLASGRVSNGPPTQEIITIQDTTHGGIASIVVTQSDNADTPAPPFTVGTTDPVTVTATKIDQSQNSDVAIEITTVGGFSESCSYAF